MIFIQAFLVCGLVCGISQLIFMKTKIGFIGTFVVLMIIGAALGVLGVFGPVVEFGMMGTIVLIAALCEQFFESFLAAFHGDFTSLLSFVGLLALILGFCTIFGVVAKLPPANEKSE